jgi:hypothetical protein
MPTSFSVACLKFSKGGIKRMVILGRKKANITQKGMFRTLADLALLRQIYYAVVCFRPCLCPFGRPEHIKPMLLAARKCK